MIQSTSWVSYVNMKLKLIAASQGKLESTWINAFKTNIDSGKFLNDSQSATKQP